MRIYRYIYFAILLCLLASCAKETAQEQNYGGSFSVTVSLPGELTRTGLGAVSGKSCQTIWKEGDRISINGVVSLPLGAEQAGATSATFQFNKTVKAPYNVITPASEDATLAVIPSEQSYVPGDYDAAAVPMSCASLSFDQIRLKHNSAVLQIALTGTSGVSVKNISVMTGAGELLCGKMIFGKDEKGLFDGSFHLEGGASCVTLNCGFAGVGLTSSPTIFNVAIPAGTYKSGFSFIVQTVDNKVMKLEFAPDDGEIVAGSLIRFPEKAFQDNGDFMLISSETDMMAFALDHEKSNYLLTADLDMTDFSWEPFDFQGVFDGAGHTVKGLSAPMFKIVSGTVKNLTFTSRFTLSDPVVAGFFASEITGNIENFKLGGTYTVACTSELSSTPYLGGIAGRLKNSGTAKGCEVSANIQFPSTMVLQNDGYFGALFGQVNASTVTDCVHYGNLEVGVHVQTSYISKSICVGSICGNLSGGISKGNSNRGQVIFTGSWLNTLRYGGLIGYVTGNSVCENDVNYGYVCANPTNTDQDKARYGGVGGVYGIIDNANISIKNAVNEEGAVVEYKPASSPSYSFCVGGVIQSIYKNSKEISGLVNRGKVLVDGSEISITSSRRGIFVGGLIGSSECTNMSDLLFDGEMEVTPLMTICNAIGGIVGQLGSNDPSVSSTSALQNSRTTENSRIIVNRKYPDKAVNVGGIAGMAKTSGCPIRSCSSCGSIQITGPLQYGTENQNVGGILGLAMSSKSESVSVSGCTCSSSVVVTDGNGSVNVCFGGIVGSAEISNISLKSCTWDGSFSFNGAGSDSRFGGILGVFTNRNAAGEAVISSCTATGNISLIEDTKISERPVAGGIISYVGSYDSEKAIKLTVDNCSSECQIRRYVGDVTDVIASRNSTESVAGGILGSAGLRQAFEDEDVSAGEKKVSISVELVSNSCVDVTISSCTNKGWIMFNPNNATEDPLTGMGSSIEVSPNFSISGGIVGISAPVEGKLSVLECRNEGDIFNTSGTIGGIVGYIYANTTVSGFKSGSSISWTSNSGKLYERDAKMALSEKSGTSYVVAGGIVGSVKSSAVATAVEYCWNSGDVAGSSYSAMKTPCAGGIVGSNDVAGIFKHCKTSAHVRNYSKSGSANVGAYFCGSTFNGDQSGDLFYECAAGGWVARDDEWIAAGQNWKEMAFGSAEHGGLTGCTMWDNVSKLPWEE